MFAAIGKTIITTIAASAVIDFITKPRTSNALTAGESVGQHVLNIPAAVRDFVHGLVNGVRGVDPQREHADARYATEDAKQKRFAEHE